METNHGNRAPETPGARTREQKMTHCVVYRTGGTESFTWHRSIPMTKDDASTTAERTQKMGYHAMVVNYKLSVAIGLPETFNTEILPHIYTGRS